MIRPIDTGKLLIFTALRCEAEAISAALGYSAMPPAGIFSIPARSPRPAIDLYPIGMRAAVLPVGISPLKLSGVMIAGLAGALKPDLNVGDVVVDAPPQIIPTNLDFRMVAGEIFTSTAIVGQPQEKALLFEQTGAFAVDMETSIVRDEAHRLGLPLLAVRAISDGAQDAIHPAIASFVTTIGRPKFGAICAGVARRPWLIPQMMRLNANSKLALANLGRAVAALVQPGNEQWWFTKTVEPAADAAPPAEQFNPAEAAPGAR
jgi:hypothetical protein